MRNKTISTVHKVLQIKPCAHDEAHIMLALEEAGQEFPWVLGNFKDSLKAGHYCWLLYEDEDAIGYIIFSLAAQNCDILNLVIRPDKQHQGYGAFLLTEAMLYSKDHDAASVFLEVRRSNHAAISLYHKMGFNEIASRKNYYPAKKGFEDALIFAATLSR